MSHVRAYQHCGSVRYREKSEIMVRPCIGIVTVRHSGGDGLDLVHRAADRAELPVSSGGFRELDPRRYCTLPGKEARPNTLAVEEAEDLSCNCQRNGSRESVAWAGP